MTAQVDGNINLIMKGVSAALEFDHESNHLVGVFKMDSLKYSYNIILSLFSSGSL